MALRHAALVAAAVGLLGATVYLFRAVNADPVVARAPAAGEPGARGVAEESAADADGAGGGRARARGERAGAGTRGVDGGDERGGEGGGAADGPEGAAAGAGGPSRSQLAARLRRPADEVAQVGLTAVMDEANRAYDRGDFDEAKAIAYKVLAAEPESVRMLRVVVSSACILGDADEAARSYVKLPARDRAQMRTRCERHGVTLADP